MRLADLDATFVGEYRNHDWTVTYKELSTVEGAQGLLFECPKCQNHSVLCWFSNPRNAVPVPQEAKPSPGRWNFTGEVASEVSLTPSVDLSTTDVGCKWHGFVTNGEAA